VSDFSDGDIGKPSLLSAAIFTTAMPVACRSAEYAFTDAPCYNGISLDTCAPVWVYFPLSFSSTLSCSMLFSSCAIVLGVSARGEEHASRIARRALKNSNRSKIQTARYPEDLELIEMNPMRLSDLDLNRETGTFVKGRMYESGRLPSFQNGRRGTRQRDASSRTRGSKNPFLAFLVIRSRFSKNFARHLP